MPGPGGATGAGAWFDVRVVASTDVLLTLGIGQDLTFEEDVLRIRPGSSIVGVDHAVHAASIGWSLRRARVKRGLNRLLGREAKASKYAKRIDHYRRYQRLFKTPNVHIERRVGPVASPATVTVDQLFTRIESSRPHSVLVSMDIEGSEYDVVGDLLRHHAAINMILGELHCIGRRVDEFERSITEIKRSFEIVHLHGNNFAPYNHELDVPEVIELTLVHRSLVPRDSPYSDMERPIPGLDMPNRPGAPDYVLRI